MIGSGAVMGFSPEQTRRMSLQDFEAIGESFRIANGGKKPVEELSDHEMRRLGFEV